MNFSKNEKVVQINIKLHGYIMCAVLQIMDIEMSILRIDYRIVHRRIYMLELSYNLLVSLLPISIVFQFKGIEKKHMYNMLVHLPASALVSINIPREGHWFK